MSIKVGQVELEFPVILAPMSGVTDLPFRRAVARHGVGLVVTEMIARDAVVRRTREFLRKSAPDYAAEWPIAVQLAGYDPDIMAEAAKVSRDRGATLIDLNFGCPVKNVVKKASGSALMRDEGHAARIFEAVVRAVDIPVTLKMRTGWDDTNRNAPRLAALAEQAGIRMLTVHGRTRCKFFKGRADWRFVRSVTAATRLPVIVNGDIKSVADARNALRQSGADGVMVGRGCYGRPWLPAEIMAALGDEPWLPADPGTICSMVLEHYDAILAHHGREVGLKIARKHLGWYAEGLAGAKDYRARVNRLEDPDAVIRETRTFYDRTQERMAA